MSNLKSVFFNILFGCAGSYLRHAGPFVVVVAACGI